MMFILLRSARAASNYPSLRSKSQRHRISISDIQCFTTKDNEDEKRKAAISECFVKLGIHPDLHENIMGTIRPLIGSSNLDVSTIISTFPNTNDIVELAQSLQSPQKKRKRQRLPQRDVIFRAATTTGTHRDTQKLHWKFGQSLLELAQSVPGQQALETLQQDTPYVPGRMEGSCGGQGNCSTCHVYLDQVTYDASEPPEEAELDMLDLAYDVQPTSRLGCQVSLDPRRLGEDHKVVVTLPTRVNDQTVS